MESATAQVLSGEDAVPAATFAADMLAGDQTAASEGQDGGLNYWDNEVSFDLEQLFASAPLPHPCRYSALTAPGFLVRLAREIPAIVGACSRH